MTKKKREKVKTENLPMEEGSSAIFQTIIKWLGGLAAALTVGGIIFGFGYWVAGIEHKVEIMNLNQKHNNEMYELRIQMNNQIQTIQNKYDILESNYNSLKERKEDNYGK